MNLICLIWLRSRKWKHRQLFVPVTVGWKFSRLVQNTNAKQIHLANANSSQEFHGKNILNVLKIHITAVLLFMLFSFMILILWFDWHFFMTHSLYANERHEWVCVACLSSDSVYCWHNKNGKGHVLLGDITFRCYDVPTIKECAQ